MPGKQMGAWLPRLQALVASGNEAAFYSWRRWRRLREKVRQLDNNECQRCKAAGRYRRGTIVHHVKHLQERPDLALSVWDPETGERQLITVCKTCHEELHPESLRPVFEDKAPVTAERWD